MTSIATILLLATEGAEGLSADHVAAKIAVPLGILFFSGSVFMLLWSNYGLKKGAAIYGTAFFGFTFVLGIFWWFGAPGTPVATGVQNFPGQPADQYTAKWFAFEPGSEAAMLLPATNNLDDFETVEEFVGSDEGPMYTATVGDLAQAEQLMVALALMEEDGEIQLGGEQRAEYLETGQAGLAEEVGEDSVDDWSRANPTYTAEPGQPVMTRSDGTLVAGTEVTIFVNYVNEAGDTLEIPVETRPMFAYKQESLLYFPSMVWTIGSLVLFVLSLFWLDRLEMREKKRDEEIDEPESLAVPIRQ
ncbi:MAG TPA: hypothetical protein VJ978_05220 [Nitriliruptoraceae bacterium]|nr:hypothetical protein [Nitriliruptoraceae bacterium]